MLPFVLQLCKVAWRFKGTNLDSKILLFNVEIQMSAAKSIEKTDPSKCWQSRGTVLLVSLQ